ncbi:MAG: potassium-transporting ATPase subunit KdpC [Cutibacterium avidum]|nr:potassium-transporting ATPase subunit KdpC [Cutibacterium avidum]
MIISSRTRTLLVGLRSILLFTVIVGVVYTGVMTGLGQLVLHRQANGSQLEVNGKVVGSTLIGQSFTDKDGKPLPEYFQPRPSAAGGDGYDGSSSGGSNMGPENPDLAKAIKERRSQVATFNGVDAGRVPADALTASSSGLDPHISPANAEIQVNRVAKARHLDPSVVREIVANNTDGRQLGFLGATRVNVVTLNAELDRQH